jgi:two-component system, OmpR family, phosphate regulon sensor histidine kinase PhoR
MLEPRPLAFRTKLLASYLFVVATVELIAIAILNQSLGDDLSKRLDLRLEQQAYGAARWVAARHEQHGALAEEASSDRQAIRLAGVVSAWVTIIDERGVVIGNSERTLSARHPEVNGEASMPEVVEARQDHVGHATRRSPIFEDDMHYVAVLAESGEVVRLAVPLEEIRSTIRAMRDRLIAASALAFLVALFVGLIAVRLIVRPLQAMKTTASRMAAGDYDIEVPESSPDEFGVLARSLEHLAKELKSRIGELVGERDRLSAILSGMVEGVLVVGSDRRVVIANPSAAQILGAAPPLEERSVEEVIRDPRLRDLLVDVGGEGRLTTVELEGREGAGRSLLINVQPLGSVGLVAVLHDVTQLRKLEEMRRDFVANISHELRTPVAAIQGYAETILRSGEALDDKTKGEFLDIIHRHARRIGRLVADLLRLADIEARPPEKLVRRPIAIAHVAANVLETARERLKSRAMSLEIDASSELVAFGDPDGIEQVLDNLVDNAIKYGRAGGKIRLGAKRSGDRVIVEVADDGPGIAREHLPRIFERFYRADAGRSREVGGAGLGLAIVKRLVESMGGMIAVESEIDRGTTFTIDLASMATAWPRAGSEAGSAEPPGPSSRS